MFKNGNELILFSKHSITIPICININQLNTFETIQCYNDIPFMIKKNNLNVTAFLKDQKILVKSSSIKQCQNNSNQFNLIMAYSTACMTASMR